MTEDSTNQTDEDNEDIKYPAIQRDIQSARDLQNLASGYWSGYYDALLATTNLLSIAENFGNVSTETVDVLVDTFERKLETTYDKLTSDLKDPESILVALAETKEQNV